MKNKQNTYDVNSVPHPWQQRARRKSHIYRAARTQPKVEVSLTLALLATQDQAEYSNVLFKSMPYASWLLTSYDGFLAQPWWGIPHSHCQVSRHIGGFGIFYQIHPSCFLYLRLWIPSLCFSHWGGLTQGTPGTDTVCVTRSGQNHCLLSTLCTTGLSLCPGTSVTTITLDYQ